MYRIVKIFTLISLLTHLTVNKTYRSFIQVVVSNVVFIFRSVTKWDNYLDSSARLMKFLPNTPPCAYFDQIEIASPTTNIFTNFFIYAGAAKMPSPSALWPLRYKACVSNGSLHADVPLIWKPFMIRSVSLGNGLSTVDR